MKIKAVLFDVNGTLVDIKTDEGMEEIYRGISHYLSYQGIEIHRWEMRDLYFNIMDRQRKNGGQKFPEFDAVGIFRTIIEELSTDYTRALLKETLEQMPLFLAQLFRGISLRYLELYPGVKEVLDELQTRYRLAIVSDAQSAYALPELNSLGIQGYFNPIIISSDYGYRKPDVRLFTKALEEIDINPQEAVFVGNSMYNDILGASQAGMKTVFFASKHGKGKDEKPDYIIYNFIQLLEALTFFENQEDLSNRQ
jgi:putative hydrolase of the HAD superfamily